MHATYHRPALTLKLPQGFDRPIFCTELFFNKKETI